MIHCFLAVLGLSAQELTVKEMKSTNDLSASQYRRKDLVGEACALVKVQLTAKEVGFEGNVIQPAEYKGGEYWVYMTKGSRELRIKHLAASPAFLPCHVSFADYGISGVEPLVTYQLTLLMGEKTQKLIIDYTPKDALVLVDSKPYQRDGHLELTLPVGSHDYMIVKEGYTTIDGVAKLYEENPRTIMESLKPEKSREIVQAPGKQQQKKESIVNKQDEKVASIQRLHKVANRRETIFSICRLYDITIDELIEANPEMKDPGYTLKKGAILTIPYSQVLNLKILPPVIQNLINNMVYVEGGTFTMGATKEQGSEAQDDEKPAHQVRLSSFSIGKYEVTQEEWEAVMGNNPSKYKSAKHPVEEVSWNDAQEFISKLNTMTGKKFRLPTEAEWEYAARGGNRSKGYKYAGSNKLNDVALYGDALYDENRRYTSTYDVGLKNPNELGIYDMSGNVEEWCQDGGREYNSEQQTNPMGPLSDGAGRKLRGGYGSLIESYRVSSRNGAHQSGKFPFVGFRLAQ